MNFLIHQAALGDWLLTLPILRSLDGPTLTASAFAKAQLAAKLLPWGDAIPVDADRSDFAYLHTAGGHRQIGEPLREMLRGIDGVLVSFVSNGADDWAANIRQLAPRARIAFVSYGPPADWPEHVCDWHTHQLNQQGIALPTTSPKPRENPHGSVVVHPGSGGRAKCWPVERFEALMESLRRDGREVVSILGEVEAETWSAADLTRWQQGHGARMIHNLDDLHRVLEAARCYVGNDSGPTHLAAQMGLPTLALFGPTSPRIWSPVGPQIHAIAPPQPQPMTWLNIEAVRDAAARLCYH